MVFAVPAQSTPTKPKYELVELSGAKYLSDALRVNNDGTARIESQLGALSVGLYAYDRNTAGVSVGECISGGFGTSADLGPCTYSPSEGLVHISFTVPSFLPIIRPPGYYTVHAYDINNNGDVLGGATTGPTTGYANADLQIRTVGGELVELGISSYRRPSFNNFHELVGAGLTGGIFYYHNGQSTDLGSLVLNLNSYNMVLPTDINDTGYISGIGINSAGASTAFILVPLQAVPETGSFALLWVGILALSAVSFTKRKNC